MQEGFIRRIDELGRIVIPKEIRKVLRFREGSLLDLKVSDNSLIVRKSSSILRREYINQLIDLLKIACKVDFIVTEDENIIIVSDNDINTFLLEKKISDDLINLLRENKSNVSQNGLQITNECFINGKYIVKTIIKESNSLGLIIMKSDDIDYGEKLLELLLKIIVENF